MPEIGYSFTKYHQLQVQCSRSQIGLMLVVIQKEPTAERSVASKIRSRGVGIRLRFVELLVKATPTLALSMLGNVRDSRNSMGVLLMLPGYCGNSFAAGSVIAAGGNDTTENGCNMLCPGDLTEYCGGGNRLNVYQVISGSTASSTPLATTSSSSLYASSTPSPTTIPMSSGNYTFIGCYSEATNARALTGANNPSSKSVDNCAAFCASNGATRYFGVEYYGECMYSFSLDISLLKWV